jgi:hypothetical protein
MIGFDLTRTLNSIGKEIFVRHYYDFKSIKDKFKLAEKLLNENQRASTIGGQLTRINCANKIFENGKEIEALEIIVNSNRMTDDIKQIAKKIIEKER